MITPPIAKFVATALALVGVSMGISRDASAQSILVFDNSLHRSAELAAQTIAPGSVTLATSSTFQALIPTQQWDLIVVSNPSSKPQTWDPLAAFITQGGRVAISHWDFDNTSHLGMSALLAALEVTNAGSVALLGVTLHDSQTVPIFQGLPMPNADWHGHWFDDGDKFTTLGSAIGVAHLGDPLTPTMVLGNNGKTLVMPVLDELGDSWINGGMDIVLWQKIINNLLGRVGILHTQVRRVGTEPRGLRLWLPPHWWLQLALVD